MKFNSFYVSRPKPIGTKLDTESKFVDQSEADRCSLSYQLERFGMDGLKQKLSQTISQFGYADTRLTKDFSQFAEKYAEANSYFMQLPAKIRKEFNHDAIAFYSKIESDPNYMYEQGYISKKLANDLGVFQHDDISIKNTDNSTSSGVDNKTSTSDIGLSGQNVINNGAT